MTRKIIVTDTQYHAEVPNGTVMTVTYKYPEGQVDATIDGGNGFEWYMSASEFVEYTPDETAGNRPHMTLPNGDVLYEGDYAVTREGQKVGPLRTGGIPSYRWDVPNFEGADGEYFNHNGLSDEPSANHLVAKWTDQDDTPVLWQDMTPEQKGALLLAHHEGKTIQCFDKDWYDCVFVGYYDDFQYRIKPSKPEPKVETVALSGYVDRGSFRVIPFAYDTHRITFNLIDGKPDCGSVKMEELG